MQPQANKGFIYGSGLINPSHTKFIVNIPKNASSYLGNWSRQNKWSVGHADHFVQTVEEVIVVLRDPEERWISGFAQYVSGNILHAKGFFNTKTGPSENFQYMPAQEFINNYNALTERLIFDNLALFDDHVWPQHIFFKDLLPEIPRKYFYISDNFDKQLQEYLGFENPKQDLERNDSNNEPDKKLIKHFIRDRLDQIAELHEVILKAYSADYRLIEQVIQ